MKSKKVSVKFHRNIRAYCVTFFALVVVGVSPGSPSHGRAPTQNLYHSGEARMWKAQLLDLARVVVCFQHPLVCRI